MKSVPEWPPSKGNDTSALAQGARRPPTYLTLAVSALSILWVLATVGAAMYVDDWKSSPGGDGGDWAATQEAILEGYNRVTDVMFLSTLLLVPLVVVVGFWLNRLRAIGAWASPRASFRHSSGWSFWSWIVPVVLLWFPYQVVRDVSWSVSRREDKGLIRLWWGGWLVVTVVGMWFARPLALHGDLDSWAQGWATYAILAVLVLPLWLLVVWTLERDARTALGAEDAPAD